MRRLKDPSRIISSVVGVGIFYYIINFGYGLIKARQYFSLDGASLFQQPSILAVAPGCYFSFSVFDPIIPIIAVLVLLRVYRHCKYSAYLAGIILIIEIVFGDLIMSIDRLIRAVDMGIPSMCGSELFLALLNGFFPFVLLSGLLFLIIKNKELFRENN